MKYVPTFGQSVSHTATIPSPTMTLSNSLSLVNLYLFVFDGDLRKPKFIGGHLLVLTCTEA